MRIRRSCTILRIVFTCLVVVLLWGCAGFGVDPLPFPDPSRNIVWPSPPAVPRIRFLREITGPEQVVPQEGRLRKLWDAVTGEARLMIPFATPYGVVTDGGSVFFAADTTAGVVHRYDLAKREVGYIFQAGEETLSSPAGVAVDATGNLCVSDTVNGKVYLFSDSGEFLRVLGDKESSFQRPAGIAVNKRGEIFVVDVLAHKLKVFDRNYRYLGEFPREGSGEPLNLPSNVAIDRNDNVYVSDSMNFRVKVYDREGNFRRAIGEIGDTPGSFARPRGVAVDSDLNIYVVDASHNNFQIFTQDGQVLLFVGKHGRGPGEFDLPSGIFIDGSDRIFIADTFNRRVQVFEYLKKDR